MCYWCGCLTHDDHECGLWIESEGSLSIGSKKFGPWIHVAHFTSSRKNVIKVLGFYTRKMKETLATSSTSLKKPPVVVVCIGKPSPEIIRPEKESTKPLQQENIVVDFQEENTQHSNQIPTN